MDVDEEADSKANGKATNKSKRRGGRIVEGVDEDAVEDLTDEYRDRMLELKQKFSREDQKSEFRQQAQEAEERIQKELKKLKWSCSSRCPSCDMNTKKALIDVCRICYLADVEYDLNRAHVENEMKVREVEGDAVVSVAMKKAPKQK